MKVLLLTILLSSTAIFAYGQGFEARVLRVIDGDTLQVEHLCNGTLDGVRLLGIDVPEVNRSQREIPQPYSLVCRNLLSKIIYGKTVFIETERRDNYGRNLARVLLDKMDVGLFMLDAGCAWSYYPNGIDPKHRQDYLDAFDGAKERRDGLFAQKRPVAPSVWRKKKHFRRVKKR